MIAGMGRHFRFRKLEFWAENGRVNIIDYREEPPAHKTESRREFLLRAQAMIVERNRIQAAGRVSAGSSSTRVVAEEVNAFQNCIEDMVKCVRIAQQQGDPDDPRAKPPRRRRLFLPTPAQTFEINKPRFLSNRGLEDQ
jgi:hypothetical protein